MTVKLKGRIKFFNVKKNFGYIVTADKKEIRCTRENFEGPPLSEKNEEVYYLLTRNGSREQISEIESPYAYYFKNNVLRLDNCDYDEFCDKALEYATKLRGPKNQAEVTTSMVRKIYDQIMRAKSISELKRLRPQFAYLAGRNSDKPRVGELMHILDYLVKHARPTGENDTLHLQYIQQFMEAILAYLKYAEELK